MIGGEIEVGLEEPEHRAVLEPIRGRPRRDLVHGKRRVDLKGAAQLLQPSSGAARRQMERWQLQPVKAEAETRARRGTCQPE
jgi:hypothetical protein